MAFQSWADSAVAELPSGARGYLVLVAADDPIGQSQLAIARQLGIDKTVMTYLVDALVAEDLIERKPDPADRRVRQLVLTDSGRAALATARSRLAVTERRLLAALSPVQAREFRSSLAAIATAAQGAAEKCDPE
jgi:DNA-binding MarR family transcriptional regulator